MPRPERFRASEAAGAEVEHYEVPEIDDTSLNITEDENSSDEHETSGLSEAELEVSRKVARKLGWIDKEEWSQKRDAAKWADADKFLENTPTEIANLKDRLKRMGQVNDTVLEEARIRGRNEAEALLKQAKENGDIDLAVKATKQLEQNSGPDARTVAWIGRNTWFNTDVAARAVAEDACNKAAHAGLSVEEQLEHAETAVRNRFPALFGEAKRETGEKRLSEVRTPPAVQSATRSNVSTSRKKDGWTDIPAADRQAMAKQAAQMANRFKLEPKEVQDRLAKSYWANKEGN